MSKENKGDNKSMFLYTALIFFVAVILIMVSFFGQNNMQNKQPDIDTVSEDTSLSGISEKAAVLSEENRKLLEVNKDLSEQVKGLTEQNSSMTEQINTNNLLLSANGYFTLGNDTKAIEILDSINYSSLTDDQKILYNTIKNNIQ